MLGPLDPLINFILEPYFFSPFIYPGLTIGLVVLLTLIWAERKMAAKVQLRYGPLYVSKEIGGALQMIADALRFFFQEPIIPRQVDKIVFLATPALALTVTVLPFIFIPAAPSYVGVAVSYSLPLVLALGALIPVVIILMAWGANNKFTLVGGIREAFMTVGYEVALFISAFAAALYYKTLDLSVMVEKQASLGLPGIIINPIAGFVFFVAMLMASSKLPFDIVEGEQEIVAGPFTEYSGILYGLVMGASYLYLYVLMLVFVEMFLSGWLPVIHGLGSIYPALGGVMLFVKTYILLLFAVFLRGVYGRYRLDQALSLGWRRLVPLSLIAALWSFGLLIAGV